MTRRRWLSRVGAAALGASVVLVVVGAATILLAVRSEAALATPPPPPPPLQLQCTARKRPAGSSYRCLHEADPFRRSCTFHHVCLDVQRDVWHYSYVPPGDPPPRTLQRQRPVDLEDERPCDHLGHRRGHGMLREPTPNAPSDADAAQQDPGPFLHTTFPPPFVRLWHADQRTRRGKCSVDRRGQSFADKHQMTPYAVMHATVPEGDVGVNDDVRADRAALWHSARTVVLLTASWASNFGHALGDDVLSV
jgi:hypothetical protein